MKSEDRKSLVYKGMVPNVNCCSQALRILPNGEWVVLFMTGGNREPEPGNFIGLCRSSDEGKTWGALETVLKYHDRACTFTEAIVHNGEIIVFVKTHGGRHDRWWNYTMRSSDNGHSWEEPKPFDLLPRRHIVRNLFRCRNGEWVLPYVFWPAKGNPDASVLDDGTFEHPRVGVFISPDQGKTWERSREINGRRWAYGNVVELSDGQLTMLIRADGTGCLWRSESSDRGWTWSEAQPTDIPNPGSKFRLFQLRDGRVVLLHNPTSLTSHPNSKDYAWCERNPLALWISDDHMATWGYKRVLTDFPGMLAYPDGVVDDEEQYVHFAFDYNRHDVIYWAARLPEPRPTNTEQRRP